MLFGYYELITGRRHSKDDYHLKYCVASIFQRVQLGSIHLTPFILAFRKKSSHPLPMSFDETRMLKTTYVCFQFVYSIAIPLDKIKASFWFVHSFIIRFFAKEDYSSFTFLKLQLVLLLFTYQIIPY